MGGQAAGWRLTVEGPDGMDIVTFNDRSVFLRTLNRVLCRARPGDSITIEVLP